MKFCASAVLGLIASTTADVGHSNNRNLHRCPPPTSPPPPPRADGRPWIWVCGPKPDGDDWVSAEVDESSAGADDDNTWSGDAHIIVEDDHDDWAGDGHAILESQESADEHAEDEPATWSDDGHSEIDDDTWNDDGHAETDENTWNDDGHDDKPKGDSDDEGWVGDGYEDMPSEGDDSIDSWGDDVTADREPAITDALIEEEDIHHAGDSKSVPVGAIAGAAAAAGVAALIALTIARKRRADEQFIDIDDKDSIGDSIGTSVTPPPEARMATDGDIEIDHTFFDENLFQENYREQELAYEDLYPSDDQNLQYTGDDVSI